MKFRIMMKDPDGPSSCFKQEAQDQLAAVEGISDDEREDLAERRAEAMLEFASKWLEYGEYLEVEFDTEAKTATVVAVGS